MNDLWCTIDFDQYKAAEAKAFTQNHSYSRIHYFILFRNIHLRLFHIKYQASYLDRLPLRRIRRTCRIVKSWVWCGPSGFPIIQTIEDLYQHTLLRRLVRQIPETLAFMPAYVNCWSCIRWIVSRSGLEVTLIVHGPPISSSQWVMCDCVLNRTPDVHQTYARLYQTVCIVWEMSV